MVSAATVSRPTTMWKVPRRDKTKSDVLLVASGVKVKSATCRQKQKAGSDDGLSAATVSSPVTMLNVPRTNGITVTVMSLSSLLCQIQIAYNGERVQP